MAWIFNPFSGKMDYYNDAVANHASNHTDGTDDIQDATDAQKGLATAAQITKLGGIAAGADVTGDNAPKAHKTSHQNGGTDEIDCTGLTGVPVAPLLVDGTAGRILRVAYLTIDDGTNASTLKCTLSNRWNGDTIAETDNIAKDATTGNFSLSSTGKELKILASGITGNAVAAWSMFLANASSTEFIQQVNVVGNDLRVLFRYFSGGTDQYDITALVDTGAIYVELVYITSA